MAVWKVMQGCSCCWHLPGGRWASYAGLQLLLTFAGGDEPAMQGCSCCWHLQEEMSQLCRVAVVVDICLAGDEPAMQGCSCCWHLSGGRWASYAGLQLLLTFVWQEMSQLCRVAVVVDICRRRWASLGLCDMSSWWWTRTPGVIEASPSSRSTTQTQWIRLSVSSHVFGSCKHLGIHFIMSVWTSTKMLQAHTHAWNYLKASEHLRKNVWVIAVITNGLVFWSMVNKLKLVSARSLITSIGMTSRMLLP